MTESADDTYESNVAELLNALEPGVSLLDAARSAKGMFPAELQRRLRDREFKFSRGTSGRAAYKPPAYSPELHALDGEWYFTEATSAMLAEFLGNGRVYLLGTPTVAAMASGADVVLVDRSPFICDRFRFLDHAVEIVTSNVEDTDVALRADRVLLDPPWYYPQLVQWFGLAARLLAPRGDILFPLPGELTRPTARRERLALLEMAAGVGEVELFAQVIEYDIPLFEQRALDASGIQLEGPWRRADLVLVHARSPISMPQVTGLSMPKDDQWLTFVLGSQVVKLRARRVGKESAKFIRPVAGLQDYLYDSVSRRDPRRSAIDLWTSRNRVARVEDPAAVEAMLAELQGDSDGLYERAESLRAGHGSRADELLHLLEVW
jgi:hypothetical protein